jgi:broad specificity phosphatase PhoE
MSILLIRHGETALNAARVVQPPDTPLSERGLAQARSLGVRIAGMDGVVQILSSDQARARMTAECVREKTGLPLGLDPGLQERNFGDIRGTPYSELGFDIFGPDYDPPGGESWESFHRRVDEVWERVTRLRAKLDGSLAVVTHGLVCRSLATRRLALPRELGDPSGWANTALTIVDPEPPWRVRLVNCTAHLEDGPRAGAAV